MRKMAIIALVALLSGCTQSPVASTYTISQGDVRSISLSTKPQLTVSRVVVLANGVAEIIQSLNAQSIIVGRDISSTEDSLADIPIVTSGHQVLPEKVIALKPDLVLIDASTGPKAAIETIKAAGITVIETPESWSLKDLPIKVRAVGRAIGAQDQAEELVRQLNDSLNASAVKNSPRVAFLYLRGTSSVYLIGGAGSGADSLLAAIGKCDSLIEICALCHRALALESGGVHIRETPEKPLVVRTHLAIHLEHLIEKSLRFVLIEKALHAADVLPNPWAVKS